MIVRVEFIVFIVVRRGEVVSHPAQPTWTMASTR